MDAIRKIYDEINRMKTSNEKAALVSTSSIKASAPFENQTKMLVKADGSTIGSIGGGDIEAEIQMVQSEQELRKMYGDTPPVSLPCLIVSVDDSGIGIPEAELEHIFERFYRVDNKLTRAIPGAGLGLYICKVIVETHGRHIWAKNRLQGGSIFSFSLPIDHSIFKRS